MARRRSVEVFGMSMLDTVTCGLGGGIILMLFIASAIPPEARIVFTQGVAAPVEAPAPERRSAIPIASVILTAEEQEQPDWNVQVTTCSGARVDGVRISFLHDRDCILPAERISEEDERVRSCTYPTDSGAAELDEWGVAFWLVGEAVPEEAGCLRITLPLPEGDSVAEGCRLLYVAGAHTARLPHCPATLSIERSDEGIYEMAGPS